MDSQKHLYLIRPGKAAILAIALLLPLPTLAQLNVGFERVQRIQGQTGIVDRHPRDMIITGLKFFTYLTAAVALVTIIYGGFLYITSGGEEGRARQGKTALLYAAIGILIVGLSTVLVNLIAAIARTG